MNPTPSSRDAEAVRRAASRWIARLDGGLSAAEESEFAAWREASPAHAEALARYEKLWSHLDRPRTAGAGAQLNRDLALLESRARRRRGRLAGAAGALGAVIVIAAWAWRTPEAPAPATPTPLAMIVPEHRVLADGTVVEFPADAAIAVDYSSPQFRRVTLVRGEAHFQVAKNSSRPFVVRAAGVDVQAVGTAFSVQLASAQVEVIVTEGRVAVDRNDRAEAAGRGAQATLVDAGQKIRVNVAGGPAAGAALPSAEHLAPGEAEQRLAWRATRMEFSNTPLPEVVAAINRYASERGGECFEIRDSTLEAKRLSGIFRVDDADAFMGILEQGFGVEAERAGGQRIVLRARK